MTRLAYTVTGLILLTIIGACDGKSPPLKRTQSDLGESSTAHDTQDAVKTDKTEARADSKESTVISNTQDVAKADKKEVPADSKESTVISNTQKVTTSDKKATLVKACESIFRKAETIILKDARKTSLNNHDRQILINIVTETLADEKTNFTQGCTSVAEEKCSPAEMDEYNIKYLPSNRCHTALDTWIHTWSIGTAQKIGNSFIRLWTPL